VVPSIDRLIAPMASGLPLACARLLLLLLFFLVPSVA
jgi:hypothetical protein